MAFLSNIFEHKYDGEHQKAARWLMIAMIVSYLLWWGFTIMIFPLAYIAERGFELDRLSDPAIQRYFSMVIKTSGFYVLVEYYNWGVGYFRGTTRTIIPTIPIVVFPLIRMFLIGHNPHDKLSTPNAYSKKADEAKIKKMGVWDGFIVVLGKFKNRYLKLGETLSVLAFAPPGTGKTVGIVVPTIFECDTVSMIVNDPKPELCYLTSGYRATVGPTFIINWGREDEPDRGLYYPSWNPLSPGTIPPDGPDRDMYIDSMVNVFVQDPAGSSADPHWSKTGRNALSGFINYIVSKCERATASDYFYGRLSDGLFDANDAAILEGYYMDMNDSYAMGALTLLRDGKLTKDNFVPVGTWADIPEEWVGHEACIPLLLDWMSEAQVGIAEDIRKRKENGDQMAALADPMKEMLDNAVTEARRYGYAHRAMLELTQLANTPDKERGSILSTALTGISIFKNAAVRQRTSHSDFTFRDLRGMVDPTDGKMKPVTVYLSVNQADARALTVITGVFVELLSSYLISNPPGKVLDDRTGDKVGPCATLFVLDEFPQMPKINAVLDGPAVGRGQKVSYLLIAQDLQQITAGYGADAVEILMSTTAAKILLTQNNEKTATRFSDIMGKTGIPKVDYSDDTVGSPFKRKEKWTAGEKPLYTASSIMSLAPEKQIVIMQRFPRFPIDADSPRYYKEPKLLAKSKIPAAPPIPDWVRDRNYRQRPEEEEEIAAEA
ncbi:MAG: type IV secretory system conjugative DNA transfer family protein [Rickettsiales bacterium]|nr:type IV secretory system conjugative DNA transfer family protein [Rickettsiales bacterium]